MYSLWMSPIRNPPFRNKMISKDDFLFRNIDVNLPQTINLVKLRDEMQSESRLRLPLLDKDSRAKYIVHKSLVDDFLLDALERLHELQVSHHSDLTLAHLLADPKAGRIAGE